MKNKFASKIHNAKTLAPYKKLHIFRYRKKNRSRSQDTDVATRIKCVFTASAKFEKLYPLFFHHCNGSSVLEIGGLSRYL